MDRLNELARMASARQEARFSDFLEIPQQKAAEYAAGQEGVSVALYGGFPEAERRMACFYPPWCVDETEIVWPIARLRAEWNEKYASPGHRDFLGAMTALGVTRDKMGDICVGEGFAQLFVHGDIASYMLSSLDSAGSAKLRLSVEKDDAPTPLPQGAQTRVTVGSMRLDALVAACTRLSRADAQEVIRRGLVKHNHAVELRADATVAGGDVLSVRGHGRWRVDEEQGLTKKGRLGVIVFRYGEG